MLSKRKQTLSINTGGFHGSPPGRSTRGPSSTKSNLRSVRSQRSNRSSRGRTPHNAPVIRPISDYGWSTDDVVLLSSTINKLIRQKLATGWYYLVQGIKKKKQDLARARNRRTCQAFLVAAQKPSLERTSADLVHIQRWAKEIQKGVFNDMCRDELESFALGCQVELLKKNDELLFLQGSTGRYFYIIFQGFVEVYGDNNMHQVAVKL